jgi:capsular polysaccharide transport system permease protein
VSSTEGGEGRTTGGFGVGPGPEYPQSPDLPSNPNERVGRRDPVERSERRALMAERPRMAAPMPRQTKPNLVWGKVVLGIALAVGLLGTLYYAFIAADRYMVEARFTVQSVPVVMSSASASSATASSGAGSGGAAANPMGVSAPAQISSSESFILSEYLQSPSAIDDINHIVDLRKMFSNERADFIERLNPQASPERLAKYWSRRLSVDYDPMTSTIVMQSEAFTASDALALAKAALQASDQLINKVSDEGRRDALKIAEVELHRSEDVLNKATKDLNDFQNAKNTIDPTGDITVEQTVITTLQGEIADATSQLGAMTALGTSNGPARAAMAARVASLQKQLEAEKGKLTQAAATAGNPAVANLLSEIQHLQVERNFAESDYATALQNYQMALAQAASTQAYLVTYVTPLLPTTPLRPQRLRMIAITWIVTIVGTGIISLAYSTVREQML